LLAFWTLKKLIIFVNFEDEVEGEHNNDNYQMYSVHFDYFSKFCSFSEPVEFW